MHTTKALRPPPALVCATLAATLLGACAHIDAPTSSTASATNSADCRALAADMDRTHGIQQQARQARSDSWKVVLPVIVGVRLAYAQSRLDEANQHMQALKTRHEQAGCPAWTPPASAQPASTPSSSAPPPGPTAGDAS
ncbi:MAG: hypothetical protein Q4F13_11705 [Pseudomonadota bacterium]|nr:hypothetical protein [Pseudomonadota bacterium]